MRKISSDSQAPGVGNVEDTKRRGVLRRRLFTSSQQLRLSLLDRESNVYISSRTGIFGRIVNLKWSMAARMSRGSFLTIQSSTTNCARDRGPCVPGRPVFEVTVDSRRRRLARAMEPRNTGMATRVEVEASASTSSVAAAILRGGKLEAIHQQQK
ncbi:jg23620 [Pararge aegeria aegeria]|uniref:Jg23620 protein n=1 Tax=Pararge aegeria aegeria TaxID=348720 RepID=A0A8S4SDB1_9NEOP|nr:jg23620 [Pararge aegeria aegeria]